MSAGTDLRALAARFEVASRRYAESNGIARDPDWFVLKLQEEVGELAQAWIRHTGRGRQEEVSPSEHARRLADEAADVLGHVLLLAHQLDLDLSAAVQRKWRFDPERGELDVESLCNFPPDLSQLALEVRGRVEEEELQALFHASWPDRVVQSYAAVLAKSLTWVTARAEQLVGFVNVATDGGVHAFILDTTVHPSVRRRGVGRDLVKAAAIAAKECGMQWLQVDYAPGLEPFYRSCGFVPTSAGLIDLRRFAR